MTVQSEKFRALQMTREFLRELLDPKKTPKVRREIRERAYRCLRHFPWDMDIGIRPDCATAKQRKDFKQFTDHRNDLAPETLPRKEQNKRSS